MALIYGNPIELSKLSKKEIFIPVKHPHHGGIIGILRIVFTAVEILVSFIPGVGPELSAAIAVAGAAAQAALTGISYAQGNIRSTGQLLGSLALDIIPGLGLAGTAIKNELRTVAISVESLNEVLEVQRLENIFIRGTSEYAETKSLLKISGIKRGTTFMKIDGRLTKVSTLNKSKLIKYRQAYYKTMIKTKNVSDASLVKQEFEFEMKSVLKNANNKDLALVRLLKNSKNLNNTELIDRDFGELIETISDQLSPRLVKYIENQGSDTRQVLSALEDYTVSRKLTSRINRIFASGESDWSTAEFWRQVKNGKIMKSSNFWTQAAQSLNANDVGRELITKPFNELIRKSKKFWMKQRKRLIKKFGKNAGKALKAEEKLRREMEKFGRYWNGSLVLGYRILQDLGNVYSIQVHFNKKNTAALTRGSKNYGGKKDIIMYITKHQLKQWNHAESHSNYYLRHFALSRGGKPVGYEISNELFANFLTFVPLPALRNFLSVYSNIKGVAKDISKGTYFSEWLPNFEKTINRLWIHKIGKFAGSSLEIFGHGFGKEGQRFGLGIARGFQHSQGQKLGSFSFTPLKTTMATSFKGTVLRSGRSRMSQGRRTASQQRQSINRYGKNLRRIGGMFKI